MKVKIRHNFDVNKVPEPKLEMFKKGFFNSGSLLWNSLPSNIKNAETLCNLKVRIKK